MPYLSASAIKLIRENSSLTVKTPFWSVSHDLSAGGVRWTSALRTARPATCCGRR